MESQLKLVLSAFVIWSSIHCGLAIKCWDCRSDFATDCADPFDNTSMPIIDCKRLSNLPSDLPNICRKIVQKVNGELQYIRDCGYRAEDSAQSKIIIELSTCSDKDGCNSSSTFSPLPLLLIALVCMPIALFEILV